MNTLDVQRSLWRLGFDPGGCDGIIGPKTRAAIESFRLSREVPLTDFEPGSQLAAAIAYAEQNDGLAPLVLAKHFTPSARPTSAPIDVIVVHTMESFEKPKTAINVAKWFAGESAPQASAHYCVDDVDTILCVLECDVAWAAPGANRNGVHIEHAGFASQSAVQWDDDYSRAVLANSAKLAAKLARRFSIPIAKLSVPELAAGGRGFIGHVDATNAFCNGKGHTDPGVNFPWARYLELVRAA